ncbi:hypothetical protein D3C80_1708950 [compost metagenome]
MSRRRCLQAGGTDFGEQQLQVGLLAHAGDVSDWIIATGDDKIFAGLDASQQVGQMGLRFGNLDGGRHRRALNVGF